MGKIVFSLVLLLVLSLCTKHYVFERLIQNHFVFDPLVLRKLIKEAVDSVPDTQIDPTYTPQAIKFKSDGWYKLPDSDGGPVLERPGGILEDRFTAIAKSLQEYYGKKHISNADHDFYSPVANQEKWLYVIVASAVGQVIMLHCSLTEYIIIFGTPLGTTGHSGRYSMDVFDYIISGDHLTYAAGDLHATRHAPGEMTVLPRGESIIYQSAPHTYMVEYGRGFPGVLSAIFYPLLSALFQTLDFYTFAKQMYIVGSMVVNELIYNNKI
ncbi:hypothetical protein AKO1_014260 [Acrasis kona]|uniref:C-8 sterol isomerase n=1 Tax=Acrasis kona TaxID=1008807 RepID=A0AAW2Z1V0_9EUKA